MTPSMTGFPPSPLPFCPLSTRPPSIPACGFGVLRFSTVMFSHDINRTTTVGAH